VIDDKQSADTANDQVIQPHGESVASDGSDHQIWTLWYPDAAAQGLFLARGRMESVDVALAHAVPDSLTIEVHDDAGQLVARSESLPRTADTPIARLTIDGGGIAREDIWPGDSDIGLPVILPGGEIGILLKWWSREDEQEWRWSVEFYNHR
jgi:hypothetical protein